MRTFLFIVLFVALLIGGVFFGAQMYLKRMGPQAGGTTAVRVESVRRADLVETISAPGEVEPKSKVSISARIAARISRLPFKEGERVTKGDPNANPPIPPSLLVELDAEDLRAALLSTQARRDAQAAQLEVSRKLIEASKARIAATRITLAEAQRDLRRQKQLFESKDVSQSVVDAAQAKVDELVAQLQSAEHNVKADELGLDVLNYNLAAADADIARARDGLSYTTITSPIDGVVTRLNAEVGELVVTGTMNNPGTIIIEVADLSHMLLKARVDETAIADVEVGQKGRIRMEAYRDKVFDATVTSVALANFDPSQSRGANMMMRGGNNDGSRFFKVELLINTDGKRIFSGLTADVDIETRRHTNVIRVPSQAVLGRSVDAIPSHLQNSPDVDRTKSVVPVVFKFADGKAQLVPVSIGASDLTHTVIKSGLAEGDRVITGPYKVLEVLQHDQLVKDDGSGGAATRPVTQPSLPIANK